MASDEGPYHAGLAQRLRADLASEPNAAALAIAGTSPMIQLP